MLSPCSQVPMRRWAGISFQAVGPEEPKECSRNAWYLWKNLIIIIIIIIIKTVAVSLRSVCQQNDSRKSELLIVDISFYEVSISQRQW